MKNLKLLIFFTLLTIGSVQAQWIQQNSGTFDSLNDVFCIDENFVVVVGNNGTILKTTDGGDNWLQVPSSITEKLNKVCFADTTTGYAVGENALVLKTTDAGDTWNVININETVHLYSISCVTQGVVFIAGDNGLILKTEDGGQNWVVQNSGINNEITDMQFINGNVGYAISNSLLKTTNGGNTWQIQNGVGGMAISFIDELVGYLSNGDIYKTIDGGITWYNSNFACSATIDIFAFNEETVWSTTDAPIGYDFYIGKGYFPEIDLNNTEWSCSTIYSLNRSIYFANATTGFVVGEDGCIYKNATGINLSTPSFQEPKYFSIIPNPTTDTLNIILLDTFPSEKQLIITDTVGKKVYSKKIDSERKIAIDISKFSKGLYMATITNTHYQHQQKIIIQ